MMVASTQFILETERLKLRLSTPEIYKEVFETYSDAAVKDFLGITTDEALSEQRAKYNGNLTTYRTSFAHFHLIEKQSNKIIGDCGFHTWHFLHSRAEIGYSLWNESHKNKGFMKEAITPIVKYGFEVMELNRIEALISPLNIPSQKLVIGAGFQEEGCLREHYRKDGIMEDSLIFGLLRKDFKLLK